MLELKLSLVDSTSLELTSDSLSFDLRVLASVGMFLYISLEIWGNSLGFVVELYTSWCGFRRWGSRTGVGYRRED
jgi:hypothetical protein